MNATPQLEAPGAGVPALDRFLGRLLITSLARFASRERLLARFRDSAEQLLAMARSVDTVRGQRPVLIDRVLALEDSSRCWSLYMVLQHLAVIDGGIAMFCEELAADRDPFIVVDIGSLKPAPDTGPDVIEEFERAVYDFDRRVRAVPSLHTKRRWLHPWFRPLDAKEWLALACVHHAVHVRQMKRIVRALPAN